MKWSMCVWEMKMSRHAGASSARAPHCGLGPTTAPALTSGALHIDSGVTEDIVGHVTEERGIH